LANTRYEYRLKRASGAAQPTVLAGRQILPPAHRGKAILLVDQTLAGSLGAEISTWTNNVHGEGWTVVRHNVPRHDDSNWHVAGPGREQYKTNLAAIKALITGAYTPTNEPLHAVVILGHVVVPYSGTTAEDNHALDHLGAWPADSHYGDMDGTWLDDSTGGVNPPPVTLPWLYNTPGDGKFDQNSLQGGNPSGRLELAVGRIDFANLPAYKLGSETLAQTEVRLLKQYLNKNHSYRSGGLNFTNDLRFFFFDSRFSGMLPTVRNVARYFSAHDIKDMSRFLDLFAAGQANLWGIHGGTASYDHIDGLGARYFSDDIADGIAIPKAAFLILAGSYCADWNTTNNVLRTCLARPEVCLATMWELNISQFFAGPWQIQRMASGGTLAEAMLDTFAFPNGQNRSCRATFILGDPTLTTR
jgi:hypothetical protein